MDKGAIAKMTKHFQSDLGVSEQGLVGKHEFQPPRPDVQPANLTDNWAHPSRGPRLPEIEPGDESLPCEGCHGSAKAHKEAVRDRMLAEFAARDAAADAMQAVIAASRVAFAPAQFTPALRAGLAKFEEQFTPALRAELPKFAKQFTALRAELDALDDRLRRAQFTPEMLTALHSDLRQACHGNVANYQNTVMVLQGWGADIGPAR
jgi:hypothetical protein